MNILVSSAGRRVKLISYFQKELSKTGGKVVAIDCDISAPALYYADNYEVVPRITHPDYLKEVLDVCKRHRIRAVLSLIDPELTLLAEHKPMFDSEGIKLVLSDKEKIDICFDKYLTYQFLMEKGLPAVPTYIHIDEVMVALANNSLQFPLIVKPRKGSASLGIRKIHSANELALMKEGFSDFIIQPFLEGGEYGVDAYIDLLTYQITNIFIKRKLKMRAGETDKSMALKDAELTSLVIHLLEELKLLGPVDVDCFKTKSGYVISEINPRFGGGYPHAHELGQNFPGCIIQNLQGIPNDINIGNYHAGSLLIKFDHYKVLNIPG